MGFGHGIAYGEPPGHEGLKACEEVNSEVMEPEVWRPQVPGQGSGQQGASGGVGGPHPDLIPDPQGLPSASSRCQPW